MAKRKAKEIAQKEETVQQNENILKTIDGQINFKVVYHKDGNVEFLYDDKPINRLCGMAICREVLNRRIEVSKGAKKGHPAYLEANHKANVIGALHLISKTLQQYMLAILHEESNS